MVVRPDRCTYARAALLIRAAGEEAELANCCQGLPAAFLQVFSLCTHKYLSSCMQALASGAMPPLLLKWILGSLASQKCKAGLACTPEESWGHVWPMLQRA